MKKTGIQRLTRNDIELLLNALNMLEPSYLNTPKAVRLAVAQRVEMIKEKLEQELEKKS